jgi:hypothetical protein
LHIKPLLNAALSPVICSPLGDGVSDSTQRVTMIPRDVRSNAALNTSFLDGHPLIIRC